MKLTITHTSGAQAGTRQSFSDKQVIQLGRSPENDCLFSAQDLNLVSAFHAEIRVENSQLFLLDKASTTGTFVNNIKVDKKQKLSINDTVHLGLGGPAFTVEYINVTSEHKKTDPKLYGQKTVGLMIQQALETIGGDRLRGISKSTAYFEALVDKKFRHTSFKLKLIIAIILVALLLAGVGFSYYMYKNRSVQVFQTTQVSYGEAGGGPIAAANRYTVFLLAGTPKTPNGTLGALQGFCTGFAISPNVLATNAHCVKTANEKFTGITAIMNGSQNHRYAVTRMLPHPGYIDGTISPDVALMSINGNLTNLIQMAGETELSRLAPGVTIFLYGFPGRLNKEEAPEATFIKGDIGRVTGFNQKLGYFGQNTLLQHSAFCTQGTSGSPIFNDLGHVVGINAGGYLENGDALSGYNFAMRIDLVNSLFPLLGSK